MNKLYIIIYFIAINLFDGLPFSEFKKDTKITKRPKKDYPPV